MLECVRQASSHGHIGSRILRHGERGDDFLGECYENGINRFEFFPKGFGTSMSIFIKSKLTLAL